ncbi:trypsin-like serine protease [Vibrio parahaemolyticus]|uniref:trypsin-like serine protease n=1 Tax=Vibrio parahaemolyticus TaxID=670 RepID=UPI001EEB3BBF|nr:trypsin-like serine protease [Vibrio parahaemolyticus]MCG6490238.1 trypsin-like serine protease [Vibrio parahaemolyticus]
MFDDYVCKIYVSNNVIFNNPLEATAFGFNDGACNKILTAGHVVTKALGDIYPASNAVKLYVKFENHNGLVNSAPVVVDFILNNCNDANNYNNGVPFVDSAELVLNQSTIQPISSFFKKGSVITGSTILGLGFPFGQSKLTQIQGTAGKCFNAICTKHSGGGCNTSRLMVNHNSCPGCSGGPYIIIDDEAPFVIGSLVGLVAGCSASVNPHNAIQSANDF